MLTFGFATGLKKLALGIGVGIFAFNSVLGGSAAAQEITLKLGSFANENTSYGTAIADVLQPKVLEYSEGRLAIEFLGGRSVCGEQQCGEQAMQGLIDIATSSTANFGNFGTTLTIFDLPNIFQGTDRAEEYAGRLLDEGLRDRAIEETGFRVLAIFPTGGYRILGNTTRPVTTPDDLKGLKIRSTQSPIEFALIKSWGAIPTPMAAGQLYQGLQTGVVDGSFMQMAWQDFLKIPEVQPNFTFVGNVWGPAAMYIPQNRYDALPGWAKDALNRAVADFVPAANAHDRTWAQAAWDRMEETSDSFIVPGEEDTTKWFDGAVEGWKAASGAYDPELARRVLEEQGAADFIAVLEAAGAL